MLDFICNWAKAKQVHLSHTAAPSKPKKAKGEGNSLTDSETDSDEEFLEPVDIKRKIRGSMKPRSSVSAEVYGTHNKKSKFTPKVVGKTEEQEERIRARLGESFLFKMLDEEDKKIVIGSMEEQHFKRGELVIQQGEDGDVLYLVDSGTLNCYKTFGDQKTDTYLLTYTRGMAFGELALLYNAPRAATIIANEDSSLWSLDRSCFNSIVKEASMKRRK